METIILPEKKRDQRVDTGLIIGVLERTLILTSTLVVYCISGIEAVSSVSGIVLALFGIKGLYRFHEEKHLIDWIIIGTLCSLLLGFISSVLAIPLLRWFKCQ